jgi:2'-5' RNA ligase
MAADIVSFILRACIRDNETALGEAILRNRDTLVAEIVTEMAIMDVEHLDVYDDDFSPHETRARGKNDAGHLRDLIVHLTVANTQLSARFQWLRCSLFEFERWPWQKYTEIKNRE